MSASPLIVQQVNAKGVMGSGLAKQIRKTHPKVFEEYIGTCKNYQYKWDFLKGKVVFTSDNNKIIASIFGQEDYGRSGKFTSEEALEEGLKKVYLYGKEHGDLAINIPYGIGCGLGGAKWDEVIDIVIDIFSDYPEAYIYKMRQNG